MRKLLAIFLFTMASTATAAFIPGPIQISTGGVTAAQGPAGLQDWRVTMATANVTVQSTETVQGFSPDGVTIQGNPLPFGGYVSSAAWPTQNADGTISHGLVDDLGRFIVKQGAAQGEIIQTTATLTNTSTIVIISSSSSSTRNYLCGIIIANTSATNTNVQIFPSGGPAASAFSLPLETPTVQNAGFRPDCGNPVMKSNFGSAISVQPAASVSSLLISAQYYVAP